MRRRLLFTAVSLGLATLLVAGATNALSISYYLDQTNTTSTTDPDGALPDGTNYLMVTLADNGDDIDVTVEALSPLTDIADANFGIQSFYFNDSTNLLLASEITVPSGWNASKPGGNADGFGSFGFSVENTGQDRLNPLNFTISRAGDSIYNYVDGDPFFAAHVTDFVDQNSLDPVDPIDGEGECTVDGEGNYSPGCNILTSAWFGGSTFVPEPSTALLLLGGLSGLAVWGRRRLH